MQNRKPLRRYKPLRRSAKRINPKRRSPRKSSRVLDADFVRFVRSLDCLVGHIHVCRGTGIEAHHAGVHYMSRKADDDTCVPLCPEAHRAFHERRPPFDMSKSERRLWCDLAISEVRDQYQRHQIIELEGIPL